MDDTAIQDTSGVQVPSEWDNIRSTLTVAESMAQDKPLGALVLILSAGVRILVVAAEEDLRG